MQYKTKPRFTLYTKAQIYISYQNLDLYQYTKTQILIPYTKTYIVMHNLDFNIVHQNLDLYLIPKPRLISFTKIQIKAYTKTKLLTKTQISHTKTQIYAHQNLEYSIKQNLDLPCIPKPRFILYTKIQIYTIYQNLDFNTVHQNLYCNAQPRF